jgi:anti-sigma regulatory factor (Ser/Thr protein kinase)
VITMPQIHAVLGAGGQVVDAAGQHVGRILHVVLNAQTFQPAWVTVALEPGRVVAVPLAEARRLDGCLQLPYAAAEVRGAPDADTDTAAPTPRQAEDLARYFRTLDGHAPGSAPAHATPAQQTNGHRRPAAAPPELVPVLLGVTVRTGRDAPVAYPDSGDSPWPALATSSPGPSWWRRCQWRWPSQQSSVRAMRLEVRPFLATTGLPADDLDDLLLAASEAAADAVEHADRSDRRYFDVLAEVGENRAGILIQDHGHWRAPSGAAERGRRMYLMGSLADTTLSVGARGSMVLLRNRAAPSG